MSDAKNLAVGIAAADAFLKSILSKAAPQGGKASQEQPAAAATKQTGKRDQGPKL